MSRVLFTVAMAWALTPELLAQSQTNPTPGVPPIKVTTRLVQLSVVVHDHHGRPVSDLTKDDFEVVDQGKKQAIRLFTVDTLTPATPAGPNAPAQAFFPRNVVTNRPARQAGAPTSITVLLLDFYNTHLTDQMYARKQIISFLRQIRPEDRVAVYILRGNGFSVVHDFTNNSQSLLASLARVFPGFSHELDSSEIEPSNTGDSDRDAIADVTNTRMASFFTRNRVLNTCMSFKLLAQHLAAIPGRKNLVWLSGGFPISFGFGDPDDRVDNSVINSGATTMDRELFADYIESASRELNNANVAVYPVDARGLMTLPMADASKRINVNPRTGAIPESYMHVDTKNIDTMVYIADLTGGKAFYNRNDLNTAMRQAMDDSAVTYTLGYYLDESAWDNKFHHVKVRVHRSGVNVRTKKGYFAQEPVPPNPKKLDDTLREVLWSPLDSSTLGITARIDPSPTVPQASRLQFLVDTSELQFQNEQDRFVGMLDILLAQQTKKGKLLADTKKTITIRATPQQFAQLRANGLSAGEDLKMRPDTEAVRIVVLDRTSGLAGSVTVPVTAADRSPTDTKVPTTK